MNRSFPFGSVARRALLGACALASLPVFGVACLDRPVVPSKPTVTARVTQPAKQTSIKAIDLLFMIDNSSSMADKQAILSTAVPALFDRLTNPKCQDPNTKDVVADPDSNARCPTGTELEFTPVGEIRLGVVSSSLGGYGAPGICDDAMALQQKISEPHNDDQGHLVTRGGSTPENGFLKWQQGAGDISGEFAKMVAGIGQHGCGYEAQLEAPYRFLIDPNPPKEISLSDEGGVQRITLKGTDDLLLKQRKDFLHPDSLVAVIMITDENDCSINRDEPQAWLSIANASNQRSPLRPGTSACQSNPNDKCCFNCGVSKAPDGCPEAKSDEACVKDGKDVFYKSDEDPANLRCWQQKRRYGVDFLYPPQRYIDGYTRTMVWDARENKEVVNPLFDDPSCPIDSSTGCTRQTRDPSLVFVAGIVGVPWQDIANDPADISKGFVPPDMVEWDVILGDPDKNILPTDPLMIESVEPRKQTETKNKLGASAAPVTDFNAPAMANPVNGHEWDTLQTYPQPRSDLQYACIFDLPEPRKCENGGMDCDCTINTNSTGGEIGPEQFKSPLCQDGNKFSNTQIRAKGYPGLRQLQVLKGLGKQAIVASVCPQTLKGKTSDTGYGYNPAVQTLVDRLKEKLRGRCLPRAITPPNKPTCVIYEGFDDNECKCEGDPKHPARITWNKDGTEKVEELPDEIQNKRCKCEIQGIHNQIDLADMEGLIHECQTDPNFNANHPEVFGWCYVDPSQMTGNDRKNACGVVGSCPATSKRLIRFVGKSQMGEPRPGAEAMIVCQEASFDDTASVEGANAARPCDATE